MMDPPDHTRYRRMVSRGFSPRGVEQIEPALRQFVSECIDRLREAGTGDLVAGLARPVPCFVVAHYLGVPTGGSDTLCDMDPSHSPSQYRRTRIRGGRRTARPLRILQRAHRAAQTKAGRRHAVCSH